MTNNKGFTLVEVIISIAVLSIISVIFLQLFVKAKEVDDLSFRLDRSVMETNSAIERIKAVGSLDKISDSEYFSLYTFLEEDSGIVMTCFFDKQMQLTEDKSSRFELIIKITRNEETSDGFVGLYSIYCKVSNNETNSIIYEVKTKAILGQ